MSDIKEVERPEVRKATALRRREEMPEYQGSKVSWYVVHAAGQAVAKHILDSDAGIRETFYPVAHGETGQAGIRRAKSLYPSYVFVRGELSTVRRIVSEHGTMTLRHEKSGDLRRPMVIPDGEMEVFKSFNEHRLDMLWLRDPYRKFTHNDRARILSGPFAGYEGFLKEMRHDMKLVFRVGIWAIAISNIHKYDIALVSHGADIPEAGRMARLVDYFATGIREAVRVDNPYSTLREVIKGIAESKTLEKYERQLEREAAKSLTEERLSLLHHLREMDAERRGTLEEMTRYIYSKTPMPVLTRIIPDTSVRPFLTPTQGEDGIPVEMREGVYDAETDKTTETRRRYYAHVLTIGNSDGSHTLITNWTHFYRQYQDMGEQEREKLVEKLKNFHLTRFLNSLSAEAQIRFISLPRRGIAGLGTVVPAGTDIEQAKAELVKAGAALCEEISSSTRLRPWQRHLTTVWLNLGQTG